MVANAYFPGIELLLFGGFLEIMVRDVGRLLGFTTGTYFEIR